MSMSFIAELLGRSRRLRTAFLRDTQGLAAVEFAMIIPLMLLTFFGMNEVTTYVTISRKVTIVARTLSDLTSQATSVTDTQLGNFLLASGLIMAPYSSSPVQTTISQIKIDAKTLNATVSWSYGASPHGTGSSVTVPDGLKPVLSTPSAPTADVYLIWSEVSYLYRPLTDYTMTDTTVSDQTYTRPRQSSCVNYNGVAAC
jgi:Flp pilus assembly protein TadG